MMMKQNKMSSLVKIFAVVLVLFVALPALAWQDNSATPPACDPSLDGCNAPINVSNNSQIKKGSLTVNAQVQAGFLQLITDKIKDLGSFDTINGKIAGTLPMRFIAAGSNALNIFGGGNGTNAVGSRLVRIFDNLNVSGTTTTTNLVVTNSAYLPSNTYICTNGTCVLINTPNSVTTYNADNNTLILNKNIFSINPTFIATLQKRVTGTCLAGSAIRVVNADGTVTCQSLITGSGTVGPQGPQGPQGPIGPVGPKGDTGPAGKNGTNGSNGLNGKDGKSGIAGVSCASGSAIRVVNADGTVTCQTIPTPTVYSAGAGINISSNTVSLSHPIINKGSASMLTGTIDAGSGNFNLSFNSSSCASGSAVTGINTNGSLVCKKLSDLAAGL